MDSDDTLWARTLIGERIGGANRRLHRYAEKPKSAKRLHRARKALARLRSAIEDAGAHARAGERLYADVRALHRAAGKIRDADVLLARLRAYAKDGPVPAGEARGLCARLRKRRKKATRAERVRAVFEQRWNDCRVRQGSLGGSDDDAIHAFRPACKRLQYAIESLCGDELGNRADALSRLTDELGAAHDCVVLAKLARKRSMRLAIEQWQTLGPDLERAMA